MPPSPALRYSPGRELSTDGHKRGRSLEGGLLFREKDDDLALFNEMQSRERDSFLLQSPDDMEDPFSTKLKHFSDVNLGISIPGQGETSELLNADGDKNDYDWLLTPPDTPLFPSLDDEPPPMNVPSRGRTQSKPISISRSSTMEKSYRSSRGSASPNRLSSSPRSRTNTLQSRGRPSSVPNSSPTPNLQHATPSRRPSPPPNKAMTPAPRTSTSTPRRLSTGSSVVSSGTRGTSPVKTSRGNSASPKIRAWQTNIPGFSSEAPPNLRTSLSDRPASYVRGSSPASRNGRGSSPASRNGRGSSPASRNGRGSSPAVSRQSMSPTASRSSSSFYSHDRDQFSSRSKGSVASSGDDDIDSLQSITVGSLDRLESRRSALFSTNKTPAYSKKSDRMVSPSSAPKRSFDSALRQMDKKSPQNMFRPLLSSVPSTTFYVGKANSVHRSLASRNSSVTTSSNTSFDQGTGFALDTEGSDHNQDNMASEPDKILYSDMHEEVFAFDKIDEVNANVEHGNNEEAVDTPYNESKGPKVVSGPTVPEDSVYHDGIDTEVHESSETFCVRDETSRTGSFEDTAICSHCGCSYKVAEEAEKNVELCPECRRKTTLLRVITSGTTLAVSECSSVISINMSEEEKSLSETSQHIVTPKQPRETDAGDLRPSLSEKEAWENKNSCSKLVQDHSQNRHLSSSMAEGDGQMSITQLDMNQSGVDYEKPDDNFGDQQLNHSSESPNLSVDLMEGTGISVLLKRSISNKGPVVRGRTFSVSTISYDDLSFARDSVSSIRSSTRHGSYSASSSVDLGSTRQTEFRVQRQFSGRKLDVDSGFDSRIKPPIAGSSFSGTSSYSHHGLDLATQDTSGNSECGFVEEIPQVLHEMQASENAVTYVINASAISSTVVEENKNEHDDSGGVTNACSSGFFSQASVQSDDNSVASFPSLGECVSYEDVVDHPNTERSFSDTETLVKAPESSFPEKDDPHNSNAGELDAFVTTNRSTITESEVEGNSENNIDTVNDYLSLESKSALDEFQDPSARNPSNDCVTASVSELNSFESSHGIEGSTVMVECQGPGNTRSLTLEEATDTILFCNSLIHDLAYQAATIAMEKEFSDPFEGSEPTVTILGKTNSERKETRTQTISKRSLRSHKARQRKLGTDVKLSSGNKKTENDENIDESLMRNVGLPDKIDGMKPPPKLESKCNCIIM